MTSFGASEIQVIEAKVQSRVADFLKCKEILINLSQSSNVEIRTEATGLLAQQKKLEDELSNVLKIIERVKSDIYSISDIIQAGSFAALMEKHIRNVEDLQKKAQSLGAEPIKAGLIDSSKLVWILLGFGILAWISRRK